MTAEQILKRVLTFPGKRVVLTGGEPLLQVDYPLIKTLSDSGLYIQVETNGTINAPKGIHWLTVSPKSLTSWKERICDELKVVYTGQDLEPYVRHSITSHRFLQPCSGQNVKEVIDIVKEDIRWRLSPQIHKLLRIP
jgi:organic radical activating enzyme